MNKAGCPTDGELTPTHGQRRTRGLDGSPWVDSHFEISPGGELTASLRMTWLRSVVITSRFPRKVVLGPVKRPLQRGAHRVVEQAGLAELHGRRASASQLGPTPTAAGAPGHTFPNEPLRREPGPGALARKGCL